MRAQFVFQEIWIGLRRNMTMTISLVITVAIAMALFGTGLLIRAQVDNSKSYWYGKVQVSIFLCNKSSSNPSCNKQDITDAQKAKLKAELQAMPQVSAGGVIEETPAQAFARFKDRFASQPGFVQSTKEGDIPGSFRVRLKDPAQWKAVVQQLNGQQGVDQVINEQEILKKFFTILGGLQWAALLIALIQVIAAVLLVANTVRLSAFNRRRETGIMRLVGASNTYIQLPFILEGAIAGFVGGIIAAGLLVVAKLMLIDRLQGSLQFTSQLGWGSVVQVIVVSMVFGILLCAGASFLTLRRYLRI
jgi:cell division transport system permease protein